jgi:hypothetical protein
MSTLHKTLFGLLVIQLALIPVTWRKTASAPQAASALAEFDRGAVTRIEIDEGPEKASVALAREGDGWVVASAGNFAAKTEEVDELLTLIGEIELSSAPIATQAVSHAALGVDASSYERRIVITAGGEPKTYFLGRSDAGGLNARRDGDDAVYAARGATLLDLSAGGGDYIEREYVNVNVGQLDTLSIATPSGRVEAQRVGGTWVLAGLPEGRVADDEAIDRAAGSLANLRITEPVARDESVFASGATTVAWTGTAETGPFSGSLRIGAADGDYRTIDLQGGPGAGKVWGTSMSALVDATLDGLSKAADVAPADGSAAADGAPLPATP